jgi:NIMA (never in mitosis gene a)-related kinase
MTTLKDFQIINKLGEGAYSSVYKIKRLTDTQEYALKKVKLMNLSEKEKQNALNEVRILASVKHSNMIAYKEAFIEETSNSLCIVMEYANNGDLFQKIVEHQKKGSNFSEPEIWSLFIQMTKALKALHDLKIFHRDLKSANVFLNKDGTVKLGDLNVSKLAKKGLLYTQTGTPYYASPEVWRDMPYDNKSDVWSLGCVLYEMTTLKPPFRAEDMEGLYKKVLRGYYPRIPTHYSQDLSNIIRALLQVSSHLRPSCDRILQLPAIVKRMEDKHLTEVEEDQQTMLLNTIRVPKNLHFLTERLPKANYHPLRTKKVDKHKFLQTLASSNHHMIDEAVRGSESVDSYKKEKDHGRVYLPPVGKEAHNKDIIKIYGGREKEKREQGAKLQNNISRISPTDNDGSDTEVSNSKKNIESRKKAKNFEKDDEQKSDREKSLKEKEPDPKYQNNNISANKVAYKVIDLNQEVVVDKHIANIKNIYGAKSNPKMGNDSPSKDPIHMMIKKNKNHMMVRSPSQDIAEYDSSQKKQTKLPSLAQDKYGRLPPLHGDRSTENSPSPKKKKMKELNKVYKVNIGNLDDISEKYPMVNKEARRERQANMSKNYVSQPGNNLLEYGVNGQKYRKSYDKDY